MVGRHQSKERAQENPAQTVFGEAWKVWRKRHHRERTIQVSGREEAGRRLQRRAEGRRRPPMARQESEDGAVLPGNEEASHNRALTGMWAHRSDLSG